MNDFIKIFSTSDETQLQLIKNLLSDSNINCYVKESDSGQYIQLYMGISFFSKDIYVGQNDYQKVTELIDSVKKVNKDFSNIQEDDSEINYNKKQQSKRRVTLLIILTIVLCIPLLIIFISLLRSYFVS